ncbi:unnamed protein product [Linum trigynum]|uniref:F-box domain-containing protein n=1 Tax=Linum trigynum TaxID=586398 RepID=A0AAV2EI35_9ROSI
MDKEFPEDLITDILWRLPIGQWTGRFRCVCKSWRALFSDPSFILREKSVDPRPQILINSVNNDDERSVYSLYSADTLEPILPSPVRLPFNEEKPLGDNYNYRNRVIEIAGSCNGLICIADGNSDLILWNPATSETKLVPPSPLRPRWFFETVGFGFDPETEDYRIIRQFMYDDGSWGCSYFSEVYCLRNDSWTKLADDENGYYLPTCDYKMPQCNKGKLYWWRWKWNPGGEPWSLGFVSFAISSHEFRTVDLRLPSGVDDVRGKLEYLLNEEYMVALFPHKPSDLRCVITSCEIWVLLKYWVPESWTKLFVIASPSAEMGILTFGISRNLKWLILTYRDNCHYNKDDEFLSAIRPETGDLRDFRDLDISTRRFPVTVINYMPSQVCIRDCYGSSN